MGSWDDLQRDDAQWFAELRDALDDFDWATVSSLCDALVDRIDCSAEPMPGSIAAKILGQLRRKRRFTDMRRVADAFTRRGQRDATVLRQYGQALIDQGDLILAEGLLRSVLSSSDSSEDEKNEARGLLGRVKKQEYVNGALEGFAVDPKALLTSIREYQSGLKTQKKGISLWHAVNLIALTKRAARDRVRLPSSLPKPDGLAKQVLKTVKALKTPDHWALASALEAAVALQQPDEALDFAHRYASHEGTDAFELFSTLRQLREVWGLGDYGGPFGAIVALLDKALLKQSGGEVALTRRKFHQGLELNFDDEQLQSLAWFKLGLTRCEAVARIESKGGRKIGSGFLVKGSDFFSQPPAGPMLLTNWHVVSAGGAFPRSIAAEDARVIFEATGVSCEVRELYAYNVNLDASFLLLKDLPSELAPCPVQIPSPEFVRKPRKRLYVIGHPGGGNLSFSLHDSVWIGGNAVKLHYRTPTQPGSSGSPVFEQSEWKVVALHHAGLEAMPRLDSSGTYEANEGISISAIQSAVRQNPKQP